MSKKKSRKAAKKTTTSPPELGDRDAVALVPENQNVESDAPVAPRRSIEADEGSVGGDVERADQ